MDAVKSALLIRWNRDDRLLAAGAAFVSGTLLALGFAPLRWWWLAWLALAPFYVALNYSRPILDRGWSVGFSFGLGLFLVGMYWMSEIGVLAWLLLSVIQALPFAMFGAILVYLWRFLSPRRTPDDGPATLLWLRPFVFAALWVALEWARTQGRYAFPWFPLAATQVTALPLLQILTITGQWGVSFAIALCGGLIGEAWKGRQGVRWKTAARLGGAVFIMGFLAVVGFLRIYLVKEMDEKDSDLRFLNVGVAQGCYPNAAENQLTVYLNLSRDIVAASAKNPADVILWPETACPQDLVHSAPTREVIAEFARSATVSLLVGNETIDGKGRFNSAILMNPQGYLTGRYDKIQLVPMGEFFLFRPLLRAVSDRYIPEDDMVPGDKPGVVTISGKSDNNKNIPMGVIICYESAFPARVRATVRNGAQCIALITNDETFGVTAGPYQHADFAILRAIETGRYLIRAAHTGTSRLIDTTGIIQQSLPIMQRGFLTGRVVLNDQRTIYVAFGDWFVVVCALIAALPLVVQGTTFLRGKRPQHGER